MTTEPQVRTKVRFEKEVIYPVYLDNDKRSIGYLDYVVEEEQWRYKPLRMDPEKFDSDMLLAVGQKLKELNEETRLNSKQNAPLA